MKKIIICTMLGLAMTMAVTSAQAGCWRAYHWRSGRVVTRCVPGWRNHPRHHNRFTTIVRGRHFRHHPRLFLREWHGFRHNHFRFGIAF